MASKKIGKSSATTTETMSVDTVAALSATGLPDYLIAAGRKVNDTLTGYADRIVQAGKLSDIGPLPMSVHARSIMGVDTLNDLPLYDSKDGDGTTNKPNKYLLSSDPKAQRRRGKNKGKGKGKGVAAKYGNRLQEFVDYETSNGREVMRQINELKESEKKTGNNKATALAIKNSLLGAEETQRKLRTVYVNAIRIFQICRDICVTTKDDKGSVRQDMGVRFYSTVEPGSNNKDYLDLIKLPELEYEEGDEQLGTRNDNYRLWVPGEYLDMTNKMPIEIYDIKWSFDKAEGRWSYEIDNRTSCSLSNFLKMKPASVRKLHKKLSAKLLFDAIAAEAKTPEGDAPTNFTLEMYKSSLATCNGFQYAEDGSLKDAIELIQQECMIDNDHCLDNWDDYMAKQMLFASRDPKTIKLREHTLGLVKARDKKAEEEKASKKQTEVAA